MREMRDDLRLCHRVREMVVTAIGIEETPLFVHALAFDDSFFHFSWVLCPRTGRGRGSLINGDFTGVVRFDGPVAIVDAEINVVEIMFADRGNDCGGCDYSQKTVPPFFHFLFGRFAVRTRLDELVRVVGNNPNVVLLHNTVFLFRKPVRSVAFTIKHRHKDRYYFLISKGFS